MNIFNSNNENIDIFNNTIQTSAKQLYEKSIPIISEIKNNIKSSFNQKIIKIIFILPNIYEAINGVSNKYIQFINYLLNEFSKSSSYSIEIVIFLSFNNKKLYNILNSANKVNNLSHDIFWNPDEKFFSELAINSSKSIVNEKEANQIEMLSKLNKDGNIKLIKTKGLNVPFYKNIKVPIINEKIINAEITTGNEIIIFNGEFIWCYDILNNLKKTHKNIKIYPNMHTDYIYYIENIYPKYNFINIPSLFNHLDYYLEKNIFNGIIVTGEKMKEKYEKYTKSIFNANEINLDIFNISKKDVYNYNEYNIIYCGRISKEKNIEEVFDCCLELNNFSYNYIIHIIGNGPYLDNLKNIIDIKYNSIKSKIIFYGEKNQSEINNIYQKLNNRIFLFTSTSETFGKTPMEAASTGIPIFIKKSNITDILYEHKKNAFIFEDKKSFIILFNYFINCSLYEKYIFLQETVANIKKYDQNSIFKEWIYFLINENPSEKNIKLKFSDILTFQGVSKFINCSGSILGD
jgi:1,2-diacylglycerol 3-alpha-glucosyltransferase